MLKYKLITYGKIYQNKELATQSELKALQVGLSLVKELPVQYAQVIFLCYFKEGRYLPKKDADYRNPIKDIFKGTPLPIPELAKRLNISRYKASERYKSAMRALEVLYQAHRDKFPEYALGVDYFQVSNGLTYQTALREFCESKRDIEVLNIEKITDISYRVKFTERIN